MSHDDCSSDGSVNLSSMSTFSASQHGKVHQGHNVSCDNDSEVDNRFHSQDTKESTNDRSRSKDKTGEATKVRKSRENRWQNCPYSEKGRFRSL